MNELTAIKRGDKTAFVELYNQFHVKLFRYFFKRTSCHETAKDLTQQTFIKLWQFRQTLSEHHTADTQCFTIANSVLIDHLRKAATERKYQLRFYQSNADPDAGYTDETFESADYLNSVAEKLPPVRKNVFILKMVKGYSNKEIAEQLSISVKTVEDHYSKAIRHIKSGGSSILT